MYNIIFSTIRFATPLIFAALGGMFSERSGVINIALEGLMLAGAFTAAVVTYELGNPFIGMFCGIVAGGAFWRRFLRSRVSNLKPIRLLRDSG